MDMRSRIFEATIRSKTVLSFGYLERFKIWCCKLSFSAFGWLFCCCNERCKRRIRKDQRLQKRHANARAKLAQEFDILNIVKGLRVSRFLAELTLQPYQE